jgi:hypothetical protein
MVAYNVRRIVNIVDDFFAYNTSYYITQEFTKYKYGTDFDKIQKQIYNLILEF